MNRVLFSTIFTVVLFVSCTGGPGKWVATTTDASPAEASGPYIITDYKNKNAGERIPEWVSLYLAKGVHEIETLEAYRGHYVFISGNEGNNFNALNQWTEGFSPELDFPRLAAARTEARFSSAVLYPDMEYGSFYEALIKSASDAFWTGAVREDDFWIHRSFYAIDDLDVYKDTLEFLILVTIERELFSSQLDAVFQSVKPEPPPTKDQLAAINRVKARFYEGF